MPKSPKSPAGKAEFSVLDSPVYSVAEAARLTQLTPTRVRRWLRGYRYSEISKGKTYSGYSEPVIPRGKTAGTSYASFLDLVGLIFVTEFLDYGLSLQKVRDALVEAKDLLGKNHIAHETFFTDGRSLILKLDERHFHSDALMQLLSGGQWVIAPIIQQVAARIDFDRATGYARRWYPFPELPVVVDPFIAFGRPTIKGRGIPTENVFEIYAAEGESIEVASDWMQIPIAEAKGAIQFEQLLLAA